MPLPLDVSEPLSATLMVRVQATLALRRQSNDFSAVLRWRTLISRETGLMTACRQPGCTGTIVDGYCDVCGSPATAAPFVPAEVAASAASPAPADEPGLTAVPPSTPAPARFDEGIPTLFDLRWSPETTDSIDIQGSREVEATLRRLIEPAAVDMEEGHTRGG